MIKQNASKIIMDETECIFPKCKYHLIYTASHEYNKNI